MDEDPRTWCGKPWDYNPEVDNDWIIDESKGLVPYARMTSNPAKLKVLNGEFERKVIGSSLNDLALKVNSDYECKIMFGTFKDIKADDSKKKNVGFDYPDKTSKKDYVLMRIFAATPDDEDIAYVNIDGTGSFATKLTISSLITTLSAIFMSL